MGRALHTEATVTAPKGLSSSRGRQLLRRSTHPDFVTYDRDALTALDDDTLADIAEELPKRRPARKPAKKPRRKDTP